MRRMSHKLEEHCKELCELTIKDCKDFTIKTCYMVNGKFPYYVW